MLLHQATVHPHALVMRVHPFVLHVGVSWSYT